MEGADRFPQVVSQDVKQADERAYRKESATRLRADLVFTREKDINTATPRRQLRGKTLSESALERSRKIPTDHKTNNPTLLKQRPRASSNLETYRELSVTLDPGLNDKGKSGGENSTKPRKVGIESAWSSQRQRKASKSNEKTNTGVANRPGIKGHEPWAISRKSSNEIAKRKASSGVLTAGSFNIINGSGGECCSTENHGMKGTRQARGLFDGDKAGKSIYSSGSSERRDIIDKYLRESRPKNEDGFRSNIEAQDNKRNRLKGKSILDVETQVQNELKDSAGGLGAFDKKDPEPEGIAPRKRWGFLRDKLAEAAKEVHDNKPDTELEIEENDESRETEEDGVQSTESYLKMLRERLRKCQPADIVASSNVGEITKRKQDIERKRSLVTGYKKNSFFETVLTAHALSKENKLNSRAIRKTSLSRINERNDILGQSLPEISHNVKFKSSPHFQKTIELLGRCDFFVERDNVE